MHCHRNVAALPDVIGSTIGGMIARGVAATPRKAAAIPGNAGGRGGSPQNPVSSSASEAGNTQQYLANLAQELGPLLAHSMPIEQTDFKAISARSERKQPIIERLYKEYLASNKAAQVKEDRDFVNAGGIIVTASKSKQAAARAAQTEYFPTTPRMTLSRAVNDVWRQEFVGQYKQPAITEASRSEYNLKLASYDAWDRQLQEWDGIADAEVNKLAFMALGAPILIAGGAVAAPVAAGYAGSFYVGGTASTLASGGAGFVTGGTFGAGFEYSKNRAFGLQDTAGGYTTAILGGGLGGTGLRLLPTTILGRAVSTRAQTIALGGFSGFVGDGAGQLVTNGGNLYQINGGQLVLATGLGGGLGAITPLEVRLNGFTSGRSPLSTYQGLNTRMNSGNITQMQLRYPVTAGAGNAVVGSGQQAVGTLIDGARQRVGN